MDEDVVAIFPLPNVVFFPKTLLPLHIFEPRYCEMIRDTMATKQLIGMFLLQEGWQDYYYGNPEIHSIGCAGKMIHMEALPEGKYDIVLRGIYRVRALELVQEFPYRKARVAVVPELLTESPDEVQKMKEKLISSYQKVAAFASQEIQTPELQDAEFAEVVNQIATLLPMELDTRFELLKIDNIYLRAESVFRLLSKRISILDWAQRFAHLRPEDPSKN